MIQQMKPQDMGLKRNFSLQDVSLTAKRTIKHCMQCHAKFRLLSRGKHHCRMCGDVVCSTCSRHRVNIRKKTSRACNVCVMAGKRPSTRTAAPVATQNSLKAPAATKKGQVVEKPTTGPVRRPSLAVKAVDEHQLISREMLAIVLLWIMTALTLVLVDAGIVQRLIEAWIGLTMMSIVLALLLQTPHQTTIQSTSNLLRAKLARKQN